jgi:hypothetical protein
MDTFIAYYSSEGMTFRREATLAPCVDGGNA